MHNAAFYALLTAPDLISRPEMDGFSKRLSDCQIRLSDSPSLNSNTKVSTEEGTKRKKTEVSLAESKNKLVKNTKLIKIEFNLISSDVIKTKIYFYY